MTPPRQAVNIEKPFHRILVTNDDGYDAEGIHVLRQVAEQFADEVWVIAPSYDQSGAAQGISLHEPIRVQQIAERDYKVKGTPTDCVLMGCFHLLPDKPDLVLSGVNKGINLADSISLSGTFNAAQMATKFGIPAIAISLAWKHGQPIHWQAPLRLLPTIFQKLFSAALPANVTTNINFPAVPPEDIVGIQNTVISATTLTSAKVHEHRDQRGVPYFWLSFQHDYRLANQTDQDVTALRRQNISISFIETPAEAGLNASLFDRVKSLNA